MSRRVRDVIVGTVAAAALIVAMGFIVRELRHWPEVNQWLEKLMPSRQPAQPSPQAARPQAPTAAPRAQARNPWEEMGLGQVSLPPLLEAVHAGQMEVVQSLLVQGQEANQTAPGGYQAIHAACAEGRMEMVRLLLEHGADVNAVGPGGWTLLMLAAGKGDVELVRMLLEVGANPHARNFFTRESARDIAVRRGFSEVAAVLDTVPGISGASEQLLEAATRCDAAALLRAIRAGADVHVRDAKGRTALHRLMEAIDRDERPGATYDAVWVLIEAGADVNAFDGQGYTSLMSAVRTQDRRLDVMLIRLLLNLGADPNRRLAEPTAPTLGRIVNGLGIDGHSVQTIRAVLTEGGWDGQ